MNWTFFLLKPDVVQRKLIGQVLDRIERNNFKITALHMVIADTFRVYDHYKEHTGKDFFKELCATLIDERIVVGAAVYLLNVKDTIPKFRELIGPYKDGERIPGTIRGDFAINFRENSIHGSDSMEAAMRECKLWFHEDL